MIEEDKNMSYVQGIKCDKCEKIHDRNSKEFFTVMGNILVGIKGGVIGNNLNDDGQVVKDAHFCKECMKEILFP